MNKAKIMAEAKRDQAWKNMENFEFEILKLADDESTEFLVKVMALLILGELAMRRAEAVEIPV